MTVFSQPTFPVNGVGDEREITYAFTHASIVKDPQTTMTDATMLVKNGKIIALGNVSAIPSDAIVIDCRGKVIYPSFIDISIH